MTNIRFRGKALRTIAFRAILSTIAAIAVSWALTYLLLFSDTISAFARSVITATALPVMLTLPLVTVALWQREEIRLARRERTRVAGRDPATGFFNEGLFSNAIEERRKRHQSNAGSTKGALLLVELGELKRITAEFGPEWSASALSIVAGAIRRSVRSDDLAGRLETGEFGVFLPTADQDDAEQIAKRISEAVAAVFFAPGSIVSPIKIHIAGIVFDHQLTFSDMIRCAGTQLVNLPPTCKATEISLQNVSL